MMNVEDAEKFLIAWLRDSSLRRSGYSSYGYKLYLPNVIRDYLSQQGHNPQQVEGQIEKQSPYFYAAGWNLCRRGILRPGIRMYGAQATADGASGNGYSITPFGQKWLDEADRDDYVPTEPDRFAQMLEPFRDQFGPQFYERAQEAVRCYGAHAYLACCAMCGAAAESILLATAIAKQDRESVLSMYNTAKGRTRVENLLIGQAREQIQREFRIFLTLLNYWRDKASHGGPARIEDNEAHTSLALLLRLAIFVHDHWDELVVSPA
jgi:hypothetical protein